LKYIFMKKIISLYVRFVQKILIGILLTLLYFTVFSFTRLFYVFKSGKSYAGDNTYWIDAKGYTPDMDSAMEQS